MKKLILLLALFANCPTIGAKPTFVATRHVKLFQQQGISDGWYRATVEYYNYKTFYRNTYTLKVKVTYGSVTVIDFGNGGSVHSGYNNEGYSYTGGYLTTQRDYSTGQIISANGSVTVIDGDTTKTFNITIS